MMSWRSCPVLLFAALLTACESKLDSQRFDIDALDRRLGVAQPLERTGGVEASGRAAPIKEQDHESNLARIVTMLEPGEPMSIDLPAVRRSTLANNLGIQATLIGTDVASEELRAEEAKFQATFTASVEQQRTISPSYYGATSPTTSDRLVVNPGLNVPLRTGGMVSLDWSMGAASEDSDGFPALDTASAQPEIRMTQPLLRGAGFDYNEASIVLASANLGAARGAAQFAVINQLVAAEIAYWNLYVARKSLAIHVEMYKTSKDLLDEQRELVRLRSGSIANVYNFEVSLAASVDSVLESERRLRLAIRTLKVVMQDPDVSLDGSLALEPATQPRLIDYDFNPKVLVDFALDNRADLLQLEYARIERTIDVMVKDNLVLPEVDVFGGWTFNGFDSTGLSLSEANQDLFGGDEPGGWNVGLRASVPIGNEIAISNYRASVLRRLKSIADIRDREITVTSEVLNAIDTCETRWEQIITTQYQQQAAGRFFESYRTLFDRGQIPSSNVTQALQAFSSSQIQAVTAEAQYQIALVQLAQAAGCLLGHAGVEWGTADDFQRLREPAPSPADGLQDNFDDTLHDGGPSVESLAEPEPQSTSRDASAPNDPPASDSTAP